MPFRTLFLLFLAFLPILAGAQTGPPPEEDDRANFPRIRAARQTFLTDYLDLTAQEAGAFFPLLWSFEDRQKALRRDALDEAIAPPADLSEAAAKKMLAERQERRRSLLVLRQEAEASFLGVLPAVKVLRLEEADRAFRRKLWQRRRGGGRERRGGGRF